MGDGSVSISWTEPTDIDYNKVKIEYSIVGQSEQTKVVEILKGTTLADISELLNFKEYAFIFTAYDNSDNASEQVKDTIMPEVFPELIEGKEIKNGIYSKIMDANQDGTDEKHSIEFYNTNSVKVHSFNFDPALTEPMPMIMLGTWMRKNDSLQIDLTKLDVQGSVMDFIATDIYANAFMYSDNEKTYYYAPSLMKIEGNSNSIIGKYIGVQHSVVTTTNWENTISIELVIKSDGTWSQKTISEESNIVQPIEENISGEWTEQNIKDGIYELINFNDKVYIKNNSSILYEKE